MGLITGVLITGRRKGTVRVRADRMIRGWSNAATSHMQEAPERGNAENSLSSRTSARSTTLPTF